MIKVYEADFLMGAAKPGQYPTLKNPEIAFSGRSNVGKSSLINSIVHRKNLAHTSSTPGKTQQINFYLVDQKWAFADLPGFGYAAIGKKHRMEWAKLNFDYLERRETLKMVCALVDSRHDPQDHDLELIEWLEHEKRPYLIVLTKCDKIGKVQVEERKEQIDNLVQNCEYCLEVLPYSAVTGIGRQELLAIIKRQCKIR